MGKKFTLIAVSETQFGGAGPENAGVAFIGPWIYKAIQDASMSSDFVIVIFHGGLEDTEWPAPWTQELLRSYVDVGANLVVATHPHKPQGYESYGRGKIFYGLGNLLVDLRLWKDYSFSEFSIGVDILILGDEINVSPRFIRSEMDNQLGSVEISEIIVSDFPEFAKSINFSKEILQNPLLSEEVWHSTHKFYWDYFLASFSELNPGGRPLSYFIKNFILFILDRQRYNLKKMIAHSQRKKNFYHLVSNETYRELLISQLDWNRHYQLDPNMSTIVREKLSHLMKGKN
jgi:hypothetical protein